MLNKDIENLPNDIDSLKELVLNLSTELSKEKNEVNRLQDIILMLRRKSFAPSSEKVNSSQLNLFNEVEDIIDEEIKNESSGKSPDLNDEDKSKKVTIPAHERKSGGRKPLPDFIPRRDIILDLSEEEKVGMKYIGDEITEKLEITQPEIYVNRYIRKKYAPLASNDEGKFKIRDLPAQLLPKTIASASLMAYIITSKFVDSLPLKDQEKSFERIDADLKRGTMARWIVNVATQAQAIYNLLQDKLLEKSYIQMDETTIQVLKEKDRKATTKSYMWVRFSPGDEPIVLYDYFPSRSGKVPIELLEGFKGYLQIDGYDGYQAACEKYNLTRVGCWDHCRRYFYDAFKSSNGKGVGKKGIDFIKRLYKIEEEIKGFSYEIKFKIRNEKSSLILTQFKEWVDEVRQKITPDSVAGKAINYAYNEWKYLKSYLNDGRINISNCGVENAIRPFCVGRKNWLFSASVEGAQASALFYSLIETAKKNGIEPFDYLSKMLEKIPSANNLEELEKLLPLKNHFLV